MVVGHLDVGLVPSVVPQQPVVTESPAVLILTQHVHKRTVHMESRLFSTYKVFFRYLSIESKIKKV